MVNKTIGVTEMVVGDMVQIFGDNWRIIKAIEEYKEDSSKRLVTYTDDSSTTYCKRHNFCVKRG